MQFGNKIQAIAFCSPTVLNRIMAEYFWHDSTPIVQEKHSNKNLRQIALDKYFETYHQHWTYAPMMSLSDPIFVIKIPQHTQLLIVWPWWIVVDLNILELCSLGEFVKIWNN